MTTFNTGNPIGSTDARDRSDNSENLDLAVNSLSQTFVDRLSVTRDTLEGIYQKSAYYRAGTFDAGYTLTNNRQTLAYGNIEYSWSGALPKVVAAGSTPETSGGIGAGAWVDRTDVTLRGELTENGSSISDISKIKQTEKLITFRYSEYTTLSALVSAITSSGVSSVEIIFDKVLNLTSGSGNLITLSNLTYLKITSLYIVDTKTYSSLFDVCRVFDLTNISHVEIDVYAVSTLTDVNGDKSGLCIVRLNTCDVFEITGSTSGCYQLHELTNVKNIKNYTVNSGTRYPCHLYNGNGVVDVRMKNNGCRRDFFIINGCSGGTILVDSTDQGDASQLKHYTDSTYTNPITSNVNVKFKHRSTGLYDSIRPARWSPILLDTSIDSAAAGVVVGSAFRNIDIEYDVLGDKFGSVIAFRKLIDDSSGDLTGRGYTLENINISGKIELNSTSLGYFFNYNGGDNWQSSDRVRNINLEKLIIAGSSPVVFNPNQLKRAVDTTNPIRLKQVDAQNASITDTSTDYTDFVVCEDVLLLTHTSKNTPKNSKSVLKKTGSVIKPAGISTVQVATVENYRSICGINVKMKAYSGKTDATSVAAGSFNGVVKFPSTTPGYWLGAYVSDFSQGDAVTPAITLGINGEVYISMPEWIAIEAYLSIDVDIQYNQYSTNLQCNTINGLSSRRYSLSF